MTLKSDDPLLDMSQHSDLQRAKYTAARSVSRGADITLINNGSYRALFQCASKVATVLDPAALHEWEDGIYDSCVTYDIPVADMFRSIEKLSGKFSIALVDLAPPTEQDRSRWVLVWRIDRRVELAPVVSSGSTNVDDY